LSRTPKLFSEWRNGVLEVEELALQVAAMGQKKLQPIGALGLHIRLAEPAGPHQLREPQRVGGVGLVALGRHRGARLARLETHHRDAERLQFRMQPRRQRPGLVPDALQRGRERRQRLGDGLRLGRYRTLHQHRSLVIDDAQSRLFDRHVQSREMGHRRHPPSLRRPRIGAGH
jgi:hypothetical protein